MGARILVIEDNPDNLELMSYLLKAFGHTPIAAMDGEQGMALAFRERPDLIICDIQIPKLDGYEVARQLKGHAALRWIPVLAVTAFAMVGDRDRMLQAGFDAYLAKPVAPDTFVRQVESLLPAGARSAPRAAGPPPAPARQSPRESAPPRRGTVLVVDDSPLNIRLARSTLEPFGYEVVSANSVDEGLQAARESRPDLILSDLHMPRRDGYELIKAVREDPNLKSIPFISSTVWREQNCARGLQMGASRFILRPVDPAALLREIEECLSPGCGAASGAI